MKSQTLPTTNIQTIPPVELQRGHQVEINSENDSALLLKEMPRNLKCWIFDYLLLWRKKYCLEEEGLHSAKQSIYALKPISFYLNPSLYMLLQWSKNNPAFQTAFLGCELARKLQKCAISREILFIFTNIIFYFTHEKSTISFGFVISAGKTH